MGNQSYNMYEDQQQYHQQCLPPAQWFFSPRTRNRGQPQCCSATPSTENETQVLHHRCQQTVLLSPHFWGIPVPRFLHLVGKLTGCWSIVASPVGINDHLFFIWDEISEGQFLINTGGEVRVLPATDLDMCTKQPSPLFRAAQSRSTECVPSHCVLHPRGTCENLMLPKYIIPCWEPISCIPILSLSTAKVNA